MKSNPFVEEINIGDYVPDVLEVERDMILAAITEEEQSQRTEDRNYDDGQGSIKTRR